MVWVTKKNKSQTPLVLRQWEEMQPSLLSISASQESKDSGFIS